MSSVIDIEGIGEIYSQKLHEAGVATTEALLEQGATTHGRKELADKSGISEHLILKWVNRADLFRVKGVGEQYSDLLSAPAWKQCSNWPSASPSTCTRD